MPSPNAYIDADLDLIGRRDVEKVGKGVLRFVPLRTSSHNADQADDWC